MSVLSKKIYLTFCTLVQFWSVDLISETCMAAACQIINTFIKIDVTRYAIIRDTGVGGTGGTDIPILNYALDGVG